MLTGRWPNCNRACFPGRTPHCATAAGELLRKLGAVKAVTYLGEADEGLVNKLPFILSAYHVAFTNSERICGLHQREDGALDALRCV